MTCKLPALRGTVERQTRTGNLAILFLAPWMLVPYLVDKYRGEPYISVALSQEYNESGDSIINESIDVKYPNRGSRNNVVYDTNGTIICLKNLVSYWSESKSRSWYFPAFVDCNEPLVPYRVCTVFSVYSKGGIERKFGDNKDFCTDLITPRNQL